MKDKIYKEPLKSEEETTINVLYSENKQLNKLVGEPTKEDKIKRSIAGSRWEIPLSDKVRISRLVLKANIFEL